MNLMFWKKKSASESEAAPGVLARIKSHVAALTGRFKSPPAFKAEVPASAEAGAPSAENAAPEPEVAMTSGAIARMKSGLMALLRRPAASSEGGVSPARRMGLLAVGILLLLLLLGAFGYAAWTIVRSSPDPETDVTELIDDKRASDAPLPIVMPASAPEAVSDALAASAPVETDAASAVFMAESHADQPASSVKAALPLVAPVSHPPETELEALRRKNAELQAQIDALKKTQRSSSVSVKPYPASGKGAAAGGVATVGNSDPKAAATTLKEAIEAMNTGSNYQQKPAK